MRSVFQPITFLSLCLGAIIGFACTVKLSDDVKYSCASDADCGTGGYRCAINAAGGTCCKPSGTDDTCDGVDNDCDGAIDNTGKIESCNGKDDDCNGKVDELFDLKNDPNNCGACKTVCNPMEPCIKGICTKLKETLCYDKFDNDTNGKVDCEDDNCENRACEELVGGCLCKNLKKAEVVCDDGVDNDTDGLKDCLDPDCANETCRVGCTCATDGGQTETGCSDALDNDQDTLVDCLDPDCVGQYCTVPQLYFQCTAQLQCKCNGGVQVAESGNLRCRDDVDNDCNGIKDCGEPTCEGISCAPDAGGGCLCAALVKKEKDCGNAFDDDGDGQVDCADTDCPAGTVCRPADGGVCSATKTCP